MARGDRLAEGPQQIIFIESIYKSLELGEGIDGQDTKKPNPSDL
jgi:hypothetical protein